MQFEERSEGTPVPGPVQRELLQHFPPLRRSDRRVAQPGDRDCGRRQDRGQRLPRVLGITAGTTVARRHLRACDEDGLQATLDYAVLSLLARLGLRGAEAAGLQLGDVDWRAGEIAVTGKGSRTERLPLPVAAGEALVAWLTGGRPVCQSRAVFVTVRRPYRQLTPEAVRAVMGRACDRAGLQRRGAHRLRHALATEMLRAGASLPEVGQVLRHRSLLSTSVYAKVDQNALRPLARPWPGAGA
jgi:integrase/recombinase XerD